MNITFENFKKLDLRVGTIEAAEHIEGADKLLKLTVNVGEPRTLVAGIAQQYTPEDLVGRQIIVVANLEPKTLRGVESHGMLLAASDGDNIVLVGSDRKVPPGSRVS